MEDCEHRFYWNIRDAHHRCLKCRVREAKCSYCAKRLGKAHRVNTPDFCGAEHEAQWNALGKVNDDLGVRW